MGPFAAAECVGVRAQREGGLAGTTCPPSKHRMMHSETLFKRMCLQSMELWCTKRGDGERLGCMRDAVHCS